MQRESILCRSVRVTKVNASNGIEYRSTQKDVLLLFISLNISVRGLHAV